MVAPLSNGPVYFDYYPNFSVYTFDEHIKDILQLQVQTIGLDMKKKRNNIAIQTCGCLRHTNTLYPGVLHASTKESKSSVVVLKNTQNQKLEHQISKWEDLSFVEHWVVYNRKLPTMQNMTSADIQEGQSSVVVSFPRRFTIDHRRIDLAYKSSSMYIESQIIDTASSFTPCINCQHIGPF